MEKEQFIKEFTQKLKDLNENELREFINELILMAPGSKYDYLLTKIKNFKNIDNPLDDKTIEEYNSILKRFTKIKNGEICLKSYSYWTGRYLFFDEAFENVYYTSKELLLFLCDLEKLLEKLVLYREYNKVIKLFNRLYNATLLCEKTNNPEYADNDDVIDTYNIDFKSVIMDLNVDTTQMCMLCIYSLIMTKDPKVYKKMFEYNKQYSIVFDILDTFGLAKIDNFEEFYNGWLNYKKEHGNEY